MRDHQSQRLDAKNKFTKFLESGNYRKTQERFAIFDKVWQLRAHFDIDELYRSMEAESYHVSRSTVYSTVDLLCKCGILRKQMFGKQQAQYEVSTGNHMHLICNSCGKIKEVKDFELLKSLQLQHFDGFTPLDFSMNVYGLCSGCMRQQKRKKNNLNNTIIKKNNRKKDVES